MEYSWNIPRNMKFHEMEYSRKFAQHDNVELFWNMEYSWNIPEKCYNKQNFPFFGIWNILEYSAKKLSPPTFHFNIPIHSSKNCILNILWNMEYSKILPQHDIFPIFWNMEYSKNKREQGKY